MEQLILINYPNISHRKARMTTNQIHPAESWDLQSALHGFSHFGTLKEKGPVVMTRGQGIYVEDSYGKRYLEGNSGLWNMVIGFDHPELVKGRRTSHRPAGRASGVAQSHCGRPHLGAGESADPDFGVEAFSVQAFHEFPNSM